MSRQLDKVGKLNSVDCADIVIVGNGIAGLTAAIEARRLEPESRIVIITEQSHPTINTPALKQFVVGKLAREQLLAYPAGTERAERIHVINARVEAIHAKSKQVELRGGYRFGYGSLLIATGSMPTGLPADLPGRDFDGVLTLHRLSDYLDLHRRLHEVKEAVVLGGGAHAIETVMGLLHWGISVHWLIRSDTFLPHMLDRPASSMVLERIERAGANVYVETEVVGIVGRVGVVAGVFTNQHQMIPCQLVLACTGARAVTSLADACDVPLKHKQGILVDDELRTSVADIYAAGDVAAIRNPQTGIYAPRAQWHAAVLQGRRVAARMTGSSQNDVACFGVPWRATQLGELSMLTVGDPLAWNEDITVLTDTRRGSYRRLAIVDDRLVGYLSLGSTQPDSLAIKRLIDEGLSIREIKKALLKGEFDARRYFSERQSHAARGMVITGKLPAPHPASESESKAGTLVRMLPTTGPLEAHLMPTAHLTPTRGGTTFRGASTHDMNAEEDSPITESLAVPDTVVVESTLGALPTREGRSVSRGLWSYSDKHPAVGPGRSPVVHGDQDDRSRSLWSYSEKVPVVKAGKRTGSQFLDPHELAFQKGGGR